MCALFQIFLFQRFQIYVSDLSSRQPIKIHPTLEHLTINSVGCQICHGGLNIKKRKGADDFKERVQNAHTLKAAPKYKNSSYFSSIFKWKKSIKRGWVEYLWALRFLHSSPGLVSFNFL